MARCRRSRRSRPGARGAPGAALGLLGRVGGGVAEVDAAPSTRSGTTFARDPALDRRDRRDLAEHEPVDLHVADRQVGDRRERGDRRVDRVAAEPRARGVRRLPLERRRWRSGSRGTRARARWRWAPSRSRAWPRGSPDAGRTAARARSRRTAAPPARSRTGRRRGPTRGRPRHRLGELEHHGEPALHVGGAASVDRVALAAAGSAPADRHRVHVTGEQRPAAPPAAARARRRAPSPRRRPPCDAGRQLGPERRPGSLPRPGSRTGSPRARASARRAVRRGRSRPNALRRAPRRRPSSRRPRVGGPVRQHRARRLPLDLEQAAREPDRASADRRGPASCAATAIAHAPLPHAIVSPLPRSQTRASISSAPTRANSTFVPSGNRSSRSSTAPMWDDVEPIRVLLEEEHEVRVAHRDRGRADDDAAAEVEGLHRGTSPTPARASGSPPS